MELARPSAGAPPSTPAVRVTGRLVEAALPAGAELTIEVELGPDLRLPCAVVLGDPVIAG